MTTDELFKIAYDLKYGQLFLKGVITPKEFFESRDFAARSKPGVLHDIVEKLCEVYDNSDSPEIPK